MTSKKRKLDEIVQSHGFEEGFSELEEFLIDQLFSQMKILKNYISNIPAAIQMDIYMMLKRQMDNAITNFRSQSEYYLSMLQTTENPNPTGPSILEEKK